MTTIVLSSFSNVYVDSQIKLINKRAESVISNTVFSFDNAAKIEKTSISSTHNNGAIVRQQQGKRNLQKVFKIDILSESLYEFLEIDSYLNSEITMFDIGDNQRTTIVYIHNKDGKKA